MINKAAFNPAGSSGGDNGSGANFDDGLNWPWSSGPVPHIPGENGTPSLSDYESYLDYLMNNPNTTSTYNGCIKMVQILIFLGKAYQSGQMSPKDQEAFQKVVVNLKGNPFGNMINMIMMGSFYSNGVNGFSETNAFCQGLSQELAGLAGIAPVFAGMSAQANTESSRVQNYFEKNYIFTDSSGHEFLTDQNGNITDFEHYTLTATAQIGTVILKGGLQDGVNNYYQQESGTIFDHCKNPWEALLLLIELLEGQGDDTNRSINGYGNQLNDLTSAQNQVNAILGIIRKGSLSPDDAKSFMAQLNKLMNQINAYDPQLASNVESQVQSILGQAGVTVKSADDGHGEIILPGMTKDGVFISSGGDYDFSQLPSGVTVFVNGKQMWPLTDGAKCPCYIPPGANIGLNGAPNTSYSFSLSQLGSSDTIDGQTVITGLGDWTDIANYLGTSTNTQSLTQSLMSIQTTLNSPSSMINTEIQTQTSQLSTENGFWKAGFDSFSNPIQTFTQNMSRAGQ